MLRELSIDDQLHYWFISGDQTSTIELAVVLSDDVKEDALMNHKYALDVIPVQSVF